DPRRRRPRRSPTVAPEGIVAADARAPSGPAPRTAAQPGRAAPDRGDSGRGRGRSRLSDVLSSAVGRASHPRRPVTKGTPVTVLDEIVSDQLRTDLPELASGDTVKVSAKAIEGKRERTQA